MDNEIEKKPLQEAEKRLREVIDLIEKYSGAFALIGNSVLAKIFNDLENELSFIYDLIFEDKE